MLLAFLRSAARKGWSAFRDGRLPFDPLLWARQLRDHWERRDEPPVVSEELARIKRALTGDCQAELERFFAERRRLVLATSETPSLSILIVAWNRAELLLRCLRSLSAAVPYEIVIVDNGSTDRTPELLALTDGARLLRHESNLGFPAAVNRAAALARGRHLLLLNHDAAPLPGSIDSALSVLEREDAGVVGARLILPDGRLQEAGSSIRPDGSCVGYGRGRAPDAPPYLFQRDVDFCSGAFLATPRALFAELGGLDEAYGPAYYEEVDYCVRAWKRGRRVVYDPDAVVAHFEFASALSPDAAMKLQAERRSRFVAAHREWLAASRPWARRGLRVLVIDDRVPLPALGSGFPRTQAIVRALVAGGHEVTFLPLMSPDEELSTVRRALPRTVEVMLGVGSHGLRRFLDERRGQYDRLVVSRPHNLRTLKARARTWPPLIYDAEALFAERDRQERALKGLPPGDAAQRLAEEVELARGARLVLAVTEAERRRFEPVAPSLTLGNALTPSPTPSPFAPRHGLLFVGAFHRPGSPNSEGMSWFAREVMPELRRHSERPRVTAVGIRPPSGLQEAGVELLGAVEELHPIYDRARVFIAPVRFGAGLPIKIQHAAAHGLPIVATSLLARQLGWRDELLVADSPREFAARCLELHEDEALWNRLRAAALARVQRDCSVADFQATLEAALTRSG